jgi:hypothetical protein
MEKRTIAVAIAATWASIGGATAQDWPCPTRDYGGSGRGPGAHLTLWAELLRSASPSFWVSR